MKNTISRRRFVATTAATGLFNIVPRHVLGGPGQTPPSGKLNIAGIGLGWMGERNMRSCAHENLKVANLDEANDWVRRPYRKGWSL